METVTSRDGTTIAFDRVGSGPAVILISGAMGTRSMPMHSELAELLAPDLTVINYDRRGRGDSGDTPPFAPEREYEDIAALIEAVGGQASLYGISSGAITALEAARHLDGAGIDLLFLYEPPFIVDDSRPALPADYVERLDALVAEGRRGDAVMMFMTEAARIPDEYLVGMDQSPMWPDMEAVAHTIAYDGRIARDYMRGKPLPAGRWSGVTMPTMVMTGEITEPFFAIGARELVAHLPNAVWRELPGQHHAVEPAAIAPEVAAFLLHHAAPWMTRKAIA